MIQKYDYIALKAVGYHVAKAFLVSERAARSIALYRISIPGTVMEAGT